MRRLANILISLMLLWSLTYCSRGTNVNIEQLHGIWQTYISTSGTSGMEYLTLNPDSSFLLRDSMHLATKDNDMTVSVDYTISDRGRWYVSGDSILVEFHEETPEINMDRQSFAIKFIKQMPDSFSMQDISQTIYEENISQLSEILLTNHLHPANIPISLGEITMPKGDSTLVIQQGVSATTFKRVR